MNTVLIAAATFVVGVAIGIVFSSSTIRLLQKRVRDLKAALKNEGKTGKEPFSILRSVTRLIFVTTQISALVWVFTSYGIAIYSTVFLQQVYTMAELSEPAIRTILGVVSLKVLENIFEHNEGSVFGRNKTIYSQNDQGASDIE